jgi:hypothetical protein
MAMTSRRCIASYPPSQCLWRLSYAYRYGWDVEKRRLVLGAAPPTGSQTAHRDSGHRRQADLGGGYVCAASFCAACGICDEHGMLLVADESQTGRTSEFFAVERPAGPIMTIPKGWPRPASFGRGSPHSHEAGSGHAAPMERALRAAAGRVGVCGGLVDNAARLGEVLLVACAVRRCSLLGDVRPGADGGRRGHDGRWSAGCSGRNVAAAAVVGSSPYLQDLGRGSMSRWIQAGGDRRLGTAAVRTFDRALAACCARRHHPSGRSLMNQQPGPTIRQNHLRRSRPASAGTPNLLRRARSRPCMPVIIAGGADTCL